MYKVTLDTNVILSGYLWEGNSSGEILQLIPDHLTWAISPYIIDECRFIMSRHRFLRQLKEKGKTLDDFLEEIYAKSVLVVPEKVLEVVRRDPKDDPVLTCAYVSNSDYLVSRDKDLLEIKQYETIIIASPTEFLNIYKTNI